MKDYINDINTKFIISSHVSTYEKCALPLKHSLLNNNIPIENIIIVKAGENFKSIEKDLICTNHNSFDHNAIIEILESHLNSKYWFITHDTCEAGLDFYSKIKNIPTPGRYNPNGTPTPKMNIILNTIFKNGKTIIHENVELTHGCTSGEKY